MYTVHMNRTISASHHLDLPYDSPCQRDHGHNYKITVNIQSETLNEEGMVCDFSHLKREIDKWDHRCLNDLKEFEGINPTAENMARILAEKLHNMAHGLHTYVVVEETPGNEAVYEL